MQYIKYLKDNDMAAISRRHILVSFCAVLSVPFWARTVLSACSDDTGAPFRFGMLTDSHYADSEPRGSRHYPESLGKIRECVDLMNRQEVDFLVALGDSIDGSHNPSVEDALSYFDEMEAELARFEGSRYHALGNHDMDSLSKKQVLGRIENTGVDRNRSYYAFDKGGIRFIVLDPNFRDDGIAYDRGNFTWTDTLIPTEQIDWLKESLAATSTPIIIFTHQLLDGMGSHYVNNAPELRKILEDSGKVIAVFQGHRHGGQYNKIGDIHYYTLRAMVEGAGAENNAYATVDLHPEKIVIKGYRRAVSRDMSVEA